MEGSPVAVPTHLDIHAEQSAGRCVQGLGLRSALVELFPDEGNAGHDLRAHLIHHHLRMPFEQGHQTGHPIEDRSLCRGLNRLDETRRPTAAYPVARTDTSRFRTSASPNSVASRKSAISERM
jgi:hypothetical protein